MCRRIISFAAAGGLVLLPACHVDALGLHGCPTRYTPEWTRFGFELEHEEPARCPVFIPAAGTIRETGAEVVDNGSAEASSSFLQVKDNAGVTVNATNDIFSRDIYNRWTSQPRLVYAAGRVDLKPDEAFYYIALAGGASTGDTRAWMTLVYTDRVQGSIGGPGIVPYGSSATYTANVTTGSPPFRYRWYLDWDSVGSGSSYTTTLWEPGRSELRLDVYDARGEATSVLKLVTVSECAAGQKVC
ncbi:MAG TPA: hypothetical protein VHG08_21485 [Longimicrobium sp.]|nr:hypothetical protein [Longimicrobium sp.]